MNHARKPFRSRTGRALSAAVLGIGLVGVAAPAHAAGPLLIGGTCEALGGSHLRCDADVSGGTAPYTYLWTANPAIMLNNGTPKHGPSVSVICISDGTLTLSVTDSGGQRGSASDQFGNCAALPGQPR